MTNSTVSFESKDDVRFWKDVEIMLRKNGSAATTGGFHRLGRSSLVLPAYGLYWGHYTNVTIMLIKQELKPIYPFHRVAGF